MPIFHVDLFASHFFVLIHFSKMPVFFLDTVCFPFVRSHFFLKLPVFHVDLFASHFFVPVHFCKMPIFLLELFASHFFFPVHFSPMPGFHLELFASEFFVPVHLGPTQSEANHSKCKTGVLETRTGTKKWEANRSM